MVNLAMLEHWLINDNENEHLEFKEAKEQQDITKLMQYCVALGNEGGGYFVLGVSDKLPRQVVGTAAFANIDKIKSQIFNKLGFRVEVVELNHESGRVLVFEIPSRPKGSPYHIDGTYFMRVGEELKPMTPEQLRKIILEGAPDFLENDATGKIDADRVIALLDVQTFFELIKLPFPATQEGILARLASEKLIRPDMDSFFITNLGAILLAKDMSEFDTLKRKTVRVIKYKFKNKLETEKDLIGQKGYAVGFERLISYINSQLPTNEVLERRYAKMFLCSQSLLFVS